MTSNLPITAVVSLALAAPAALADDAMKEMQSQPLHHFEDQSAIENTNADLFREEHGVYTVAKTTGLEPGHAVTLWWVVFNNPENCTGGECGEDDIFNLDADGNYIENADASPPMNMEGIESAGISVLRADGLVIDQDGTAEFRGHLPVGDAHEAMFGPGLIDPQKAEIHLVVRDHQAAMPGKVNEMINSMHGGCDAMWPNTPCTDLQYSVFTPLESAT